MNLADTIKNMVKEKYGEIARRSSQNKDKALKNEHGCGCGCAPSSNSPQINEINDYSFVGEDYSLRPGYNPDADLNLGCGVPTDIANIRDGDTVIDLGSGAGNDAFIVRTLVGINGKVIGIDFTEEMIAKAKENNLKMGYTNVNFILGEIEQLPLENNIADVVISNCVINLVPNKKQAFSEIYRVLKNGGHFSISDIVLSGSGELPAAVKSAVAAYTGCVAGALSKDEYLKIVNDAGFKNVRIARQRQIEVPDEILRSLFSQTEIKNLQESGIAIFSINLYGEKLYHPS